MSKMGIRAAKKGFGEVHCVKVDADMMIQREQRNISRIPNPHLRVGQRGCHSGYFPPHKQWTSRLEQQMAELERKKTK